jgi:hypothetical protein
MKVHLLDGINLLSISGDQKIIMKKISTNIVDSLSIIYDINDIKSMRFYIKGIEKVVALQIIVSLKFIESDDVINITMDRMSKVNVPNDDDPGLSFMMMYKIPIMDSLYGVSSHSEINFWYQFTNEEILKWNGNHIYSFDMF